MTKPDFETSRRLAWIAVALYIIGLGIAAVLRTRIAPVLFPKAIAFEASRDYLFRTVSQIMLNYRGAPLSAGSAGRVRGGDRLPWVRGEAVDNFASLSAMTWQVHVYGSASAELTLTDRIRACATGDRTKCT